MPWWGWLIAAGVGTYAFCAFVFFIVAGAVVSRF